MAHLDIRPKCSCVITLGLEEEEARALLALTVYGDDAFIDAFKTKLGRSDLEPAEAGLRSLFKGVRDILPGLLHRIDNARIAFEGTKK
jgi:hypothetical protein